MLFLKVVFLDQHNFGESACLVYIQAGNSYIISGVAFGSPDGSNMAVVLLGHNHLVHGPTLNVEAIQLTEIYEYTQRLQVSDYLLPHFQIYRLLFGRQLCDWGLVEEAQKLFLNYVDIIQF